MRNDHSKMAEDRNEKADDRSKWPNLKVAAEDLSKLLTIVVPVKDPRTKTGQFFDFTVPVQGPITGWTRQVLGETDAFFEWAYDKSHFDRIFTWNLLFMNWIKYS